MKFLIVTNGFIGDILFASSIAKKLHEEYIENVIVDYYIPLPQPKRLLELNPHINEVFTYDIPPDQQNYNSIISLPPINQNIPATIQLQQYCNIKNSSLEYEIFTDPEYDALAYYILHKFKQNNKPTVAYVRNWESRAYQSTEAHLKNGTGAPHRDISKIIEFLKSHVNLVPVGLESNIISTHTTAKNTENYTKTASIIKLCDFCIGPEGGLTNLSAGMGITCIYTTDFIWQNYGPTGRVTKCNFPQMGPKIYFPTAKHLPLDPCITDDNIGPTILTYIKENWNA